MIIFCIKNTVFIKFICTLLGLLEFPFYLVSVVVQNTRGKIFQPRVLWTVAPIILYVAFLNVYACTIKTFLIAR